MCPQHKPLGSPCTCATLVHEVGAQCNTPVGFGQYSMVPGWLPTPAKCKSWRKWGKSQKDFGATIQDKRKNNENQSINRQNRNFPPKFLSFIFFCFLRWDSYLRTKQPDSFDLIPEYPFCQTILTLIPALASLFSQTTLGTSKKRDAHQALGACFH